MRIFACEHLTREAVWFPELTRHANTATRIDRVELLSADPRQAAEHMARLIDQPVDDGRRWRVARCARAASAVISSSSIVPRWRSAIPAFPLDGLPEEGGVTLALRVANVDAAKSAVGGRGVTTKPGRDHRCAAATRTA